ncbi:hypothetical protein JCM16303_004837 [Sporobolomyces ruberrimus]
MTLSRAAARKFQLLSSFDSDLPAENSTDSTPLSPSPAPTSTPSPPRSLSSFFTVPGTLREVANPSPEVTEEKPNKRGRLYPGSRIEVSLPFPHLNSLRFPHSLTSLRNEDIYDDPFSPPPTYDSFTSSFSTSEYVSSLILHDQTNLDLITTIPTRASTELDDEDGVEVEVEVEEVEELVWVYEHLRKVVEGLQVWVGVLQYECGSGITDNTDEGEEGEGERRGDCQEMRAGEWLYLCVAHQTPPSVPCSALSYISHVLDGSSSLLTSLKYFPSRINLDDNGGGGGGGSGGEKTKSLLSTVARRLYRCFSHTYIHHSKTFFELESETWLLRRFVKLNEKFGLIPESESSLLVIPELEFDGNGIVEGEEGEGKEYGNGNGNGNGFEGYPEDEGEIEEDHEREAEDGGIRLVN